MSELKSDLSFILKGIILNDESYNLHGLYINDKFDQRDIVEFQKYGVSVEIRDDGFTNRPDVRRNSICCVVGAFTRDGNSIYQIHI